MPVIPEVLKMRPLALNQSVVLLAGLAGLAVIVPLIAFALEPAARPPGFHTTQEPAINHHHRVHHGKLHSIERQLRPPSHASGLRENVTAPRARARQQHQKPRARQPQNNNQRAHQRGEQEPEQYPQEPEQYVQEPLNRELSLGEVADDEVAPSTVTSLVMRPANGPARNAPAAGADEDRKLLCLFRVYMDSLVSTGKVDMNDRLVFLVPLIIIYWHHRHPHHALPYREIDGLLRDVGPEAQVHRLVLQEVSKRVGNECAHENGPLASTLSRQQNKQAKAVEAMRILREWLDDEERLEEQTARQSGAREIRHWFRDLVGANRRRGGGAAPTTAVPSRVASATAAPFQEALPIETTTEFYGLPHFENRTREYQDQTTLKPTVVNMTLLNELNQLQSPSSNSSSTSGAVSRASGSTPQPPTHYGEFFDLVTSIIEEINVLHNSTAAIMALPTTSPTAV